MLRDRRPDRRHRRVPGAHGRRARQRRPGDHAARQPAVVLTFRLPIASSHPATRMRIRVGFVLITLVLSQRSASAQQRPLGDRRSRNGRLGLMLIEAGVDYQHDDVLSGCPAWRATCCGCRPSGSASASARSPSCRSTAASTTAWRVTSRMPAPLSRVLDFTGDRTGDVEDITVATKIRLAAEKPGQAGSRRPLRDPAAECVERERARASTRPTSTRRC